MFLKPFYGEVRVALAGVWNRPKNLSFGATFEVNDKIDKSDFQQCLEKRNSACEN